MSKKPPRNERRKASKAAAAKDAPTGPTPVEIVRRRRNRRMIFLGVVAVMSPLLEVVAYRYRSILITVANRSDEVVTNIKVTYPGGSFEAKELKPGGELTQLARPTYTFSKDEFSTYRTIISFSTADGSSIRQNGRTGTIDYSARETYTIQTEGANGTMGIKHTTSPGIPLGTIRDLLAKLGLG